MHIKHSPCVGEISLLVKCLSSSSKDEWRHVCNHCPEEATADVLRNPVAKKKSVAALDIDNTNRYRLYIYVYIY